MSKKLIIVIALLAVAAFIAWRKGWFAKVGAVEITTTPIAPNTGDTDSIINGTSMNTLEKERCRAMVQYIEKAAKAGTWSMKTTSDRALKNGVTLNQQIVMDAVWQMYEKQNLFGKEYADRINNEIKSM